MKKPDRANLSERENMKKEEGKLIRKFTKPELLKIIKNQDSELERLEREYRRAVRTVASYRNIIQTEFRSTPDYWNRILDDMVADETEDQIPPDAREPNPLKSKKKEIKDLECGYQ